MPTKSTTKRATLKIQKWGNSLAVRIPAPVARSAHLVEGQPVEVSAHEAGVAIRPVGEPAGDASYLAAARTVPR